MASKETFYVGDNPTLIFECRRPDPHRFEDSDGLPANPSSAEYRVFNKTSAEMFAVDTKDVFGTDDNLIRIEPAVEEEDMGALLFVKFPPELFEVPGSYNIYLSTIFTDENDVITDRNTDNYRIDVSEFR